MATETDQILSQIPLSQLAARLGTDEQTAREAAEAVLPTLLAGVTNEAQDPRRADALAAAVAQDHDPGTLASDDPVAKVNPAEGDKIVSHLFGDDRGAVEQQLQGALGGGTAGSLASKLLPLLAPLVMSWLAGKVTGGRGQGGGGGGLGDILGDVLRRGAGSAGAGRGSGGGGLGDILGDVFGGGAGSAGSGSAGTARGPGGGLGDILGQLGGKAGSGTGLDDLLGSILGPGGPSPRR